MLITGQINAFSLINQLWLLFFLLWALASIVSPGIKARTRNTSSIYSRWVHFLLLVVAIGISSGELIYLLNFPVLPSWPFLVAIGELLFYVSLCFALWAMLSVGLKNPEGSEELCLLQTGPYKYFRHPVYTAALASFLGVFFVSLSAAALLGMCIAYFLFIKKIKAEEREMLRLFGARYLNYMTTSWSLFPFIY